MAFTNELGYDYGEVTLLRNSGKALLVVDSARRSFWVPVSQLHKDSEIQQRTSYGSKGMLIVTLWFARQNGWIDEAGYNLRGTG